MTTTITKNQFGFHNPTSTTKYAVKFMAQGYEVEDASWKNDITDSLIVTHMQQDNGSFHIHIPNAEVNDHNNEKFADFVLSPFDYNLGETDTEKSKIVPTFEGVIKELTK